MLIHLRDRFGNPCHWPYDPPADNEPNETGGGGGGQPKVVNLPAADPRWDENLALRVQMHMTGIALDEQEARPHELRVSPRDEAYGQYEARHTLSRAGKFIVRHPPHRTRSDSNPCDSDIEFEATRTSRALLTPRTGSSLGQVVLTLGGKPIAGSPLKFTVVAAKAAGIKTRLLLPAASAEAKKGRLLTFGLELEQRASLSARTLLSTQRAATNLRVRVYSPARIRVLSPTHVHPCMACVCRSCHRFSG